MQDDAGNIASTVTLLNTYKRRNLRRSGTVRLVAYSTVIFKNPLATSEIKPRNYRANSGLLGNSCHSTVEFSRICSPNRCGRSFVTIGHEDIRSGVLPVSMRAWIRAKRTHFRGCLRHGCGFRPYIVVCPRGGCTTKKPARSGTSTGKRQSVLHRASGLLSVQSATPRHFTMSCCWRRLVMADNINALDWLERKFTHDEVRVDLRADLRWFRSGRVVLFYQYHG